MLEWILFAAIVILGTLWIYTAKLAEDLSVRAFDQGYQSGFEAGRKSEKIDRFNLGQTVRAMRAAQAFDTIMQDEDLAITGTEASRIKKAIEEAMGEKEGQ